MAHLPNDDMCQWIGVKDNKVLVVVLLPDEPLNELSNTRLSVGYSKITTEEKSFGSPTS
jgi:hypothetical protein